MPDPYGGGSGSEKKGAWKIPVGGGEPVRINIAGGTPKQSPDGRYFYLERGWPDDFSIWRVPVEGGEPVRVAESLSPATAWYVVDHGIYYTGRPEEDGHSRIYFKNADTGELRTIAVLQAKSGWGLTVSPDRQTLLFTQSDSSGSDLRLVENFR